MNFTSTSNMISWQKMTMMMMAVVLVSLNLSGVNSLPYSCSVPEASSEPECHYGTTRDFCGNTVCLKGPGQMCGFGRFPRYGKCAEGLFCNNCNECQGCSFDFFICFDGGDCIL